MAIREGRWDCNDCGRIANLGREENCPGCGKPRSKDVKFYLLENESVVIDIKQIERAKVGPDWYCNFCNGSNPANQKICNGCGASRERDSSAHLVTDYNFADRKSVGGVSIEKDGGKDEEFSNHGLYSGSKNSKDGMKLNKILAIGAAIFGFFIIAFLISLFFKTHDVPIKVSNFSWSRSIEIEKYTKVHESDWDSPIGAYNVREEQKIHHYEQVQVGEETYTETESYEEQVGSHTVVVGQRDLGNGYFEDITEEVPDYETRTREITKTRPVYEDQPVYRTWYEYDIDKWVYDHNENSSGQDHNPYWPKINIEKNQREGSRKETYSVVFRSMKEDDKHDTYQLNVDLNQWMNFKINEEHIGKVNTFGTLLRVEKE